MQRAKQPHGFTLVELMVCVALLAALLLLVFAFGGKARQRTLGAKCMANLRQIGVAFHQYIADHDGMFPATRTQHQRDPKTGNRIAKPFLYDVLSPYLPHVPFTGSGPLYAPGAKPSLAGVWWCPGDTARDVRYAHLSYGSVMAFGGAKAARQLWDEQPNPGYDPRYAYLRNLEKPPAQLIYMIDFDKKSSATRTGAVDAAAWPMKLTSTLPEPGNADDLRVDFHRHGNVANALFLDGGVRPLTARDLYRTGTTHIDPVQP